MRLERVKSHAHHNPWMSRWCGGGRVFHYLLCGLVSGCAIRVMMSSRSSSRPDRPREGREQRPTATSSEDMYSTASNEAASATSDENNSIVRVESETSNDSNPQRPHPPLPFGNLTRIQLEPSTHDTETQDGEDDNEQQQRREETVTSSSSYSYSTQSTSSSSSNTSSSGSLEILPGSQMCIMKAFNWWFINRFYKASRIPFSVPCLQQLIDDNPNPVYGGKTKPNLNLVATLIRKRYAQQLAKAEDARGAQPPRFLTYRCHKWCGGLGDRLRGTTFALFASLFTKSRFAMFHRPVQWDHFFQAVPELQVMSESFFDDKPWYDPTLDLDPQLQEHNVPFAAFKAIDHGTAPNPGPPFNVTKAFFSREAAPFASEPHHIVLTRTNYIDWIERMEPQFANEFQGYRLHGLFWGDFQHLFMRLYMGKYTPYLQETLQPHLDRLGVNLDLSAAVSTQQSQSSGMEPEQQQPEELEHTKPYIVGVQIRIGTSLGDPERQSLESVDIMTDKVVELCYWQRQRRLERLRPERPCQIWLTSDSKEAIARVQMSMSIHNIAVLLDDREISHIDKPDGHGQIERENKDNNADVTDSQSDALSMYEEAKTGHLKTFVDWVALAVAPNAYVISRSGFSESATWYRSHLRTGRMGWRPMYVLVDAPDGGYELATYVGVEQNADAEEEVG